METWLLILNLAVTAALFGLIWIIQLVHYPSFAFIDPRDFKAFHQLHTRNISFFVAPMMVLELSLAVVLLIAVSASEAYWGHLLLNLALWVSTFFVQVPLHGRLASGKDIAVIHRLTRTNWMRTVLWTVKLLLALFLLIQLHLYS